MISSTEPKVKTKEYLPSRKIVKSSFPLKINFQVATRFNTLSPEVRIEESLSKIIDSNHTLELQPITNRLGEFAAKLETKTLYNTFLLTREIIKISKLQDLYWSTPMINVNDDSDVVLEWWNKNKKLTFYINQSTLDYIKVWGADIDSEMEDGLINSMQDCSIGQLWQWISS